MYFARLAAGSSAGFGVMTDTTVRNGDQCRAFNYPCPTGPCPLVPLRLGGVVPAALSVRQAPKAPVG